MFERFLFSQSSQGKHITSGLTAPWVLQSKSSAGSMNDLQVRASLAISRLPWGRPDPGAAPSIKNPMICTTSSLITRQACISAIQGRRRLFLKISKTEAGVRRLAQKILHTSPREATRSTICDSNFWSSGQGRLALHVHICTCLAQSADDKNHDNPPPRSTRNSSYSKT